MARSKATLSTALVALQREAKTLPRDGANDRYLYTRADTVAAQARALFSAAGLSWSRVSTTMRPPALGVTPVDEGAYVGDVVIAWTLRHDSGETLDGVGEYPVVVTPQRPHDKAVAAAITYGCAQILVGLLCWDRENVAAVDRRVDGPELPRGPLCRGRAAAIAKACSERTRELAAIVAADESATWSRMLAQAHVARRGRRDVRPDELTVEQGKAVNQLLKSTLATERAKRANRRGASPSPSQVGGAP